MCHFWSTAPHFHPTIDKPFSTQTLVKLLVLVKNNAMWHPNIGQYKLIDLFTIDMPFDNHVNWAFNHLFQNGHIHVIIHLNYNRH